MMLRACYGSPVLREAILPSARLLRACYAQSVTDVCYGPVLMYAMMLRACYGQPGTERGYGANRRFGVSSASSELEQVRG
eukprot:2588903-Rhodomonas_salina.3